ncbi:hypothetical protein QCA50_011229 [Cerrena zonata]|uniref:Uncharacterized protein n=1 Tax=Cerrena zonata TaxID=2478898 RepID=A0AAW0G0H7_9APHY
MSFFLTLVPTATLTPVLHTRRITGNKVAVGLPVINLSKLADGRLGVKGLNASWTGAMRDHVLNNTGGAENGVGSAGGNSGGYDQLGYGTLLFRLDSN